MLSPGSRVCFCRLVPGCGKFHRGLIAFSNQARHLIMNARDVIEMILINQAHHITAITRLRKTGRNHFGFRGIQGDNRFQVMAVEGFKDCQNNGSRFFGLVFMVCRIGIERHEAKAKNGGKHGWFEKVCHWYSPFLQLFQR